MGGWFTSDFGTKTFPLSFQQYLIAFVCLSSSRKGGFITHFLPKYVWPSSFNILLDVMMYVCVCLPVSVCFFVVVAML